MDAGDHAPHGTPCQLDRRDVDRQDRAAALDDPALRGREAALCSGGEGENAPGCGAQFDRVAREIRDLFGAQRDHLAARFRQAIRDLLAPCGGGDEVQPDQRELGRDAHHDVGVINRHPVGNGVEDHRFVAERGAEAFEHDRVGAMRASGVCHAIQVVQHHRAGALEEQAIDLQTGIVDDLLNPVALLEQFDDVGSTLAAAVR